MLKNSIAFPLNRFQIIIHRVYRLEMYISVQQPNDKQLLDLFKMALATHHSIHPSLFTCFLSTFAKRGNAPYGKHTTLHTCTLAACDIDTAVRSYNYFRTNYLYYFVCVSVCGMCAHECMWDLRACLVHDVQ